MKKSYWIAVSLLFGTVLALEFDIARRTTARIIAKKNQSAPIKSIATNETNTEVLASVSIPIAEPVSFEKYFLLESKQIANLQANPSEIEQRLNRLADSMTTQDIHRVAKIIQDIDKSADERALAVEVLSRKKTPQSLQALEDFVRSQQRVIQQVGSHSESHLQDFESVMKAQAIEGIAAYPQKDLALTSLNTLSKQVDESFLLDRIIRSSENVKGDAEAVQQQDDASLKKLIE